MPRAAGDVESNYLTLNQHGDCHSQFDIIMLNGTQMGFEVDCRRTLSRAI